MQHATRRRTDLRVSPASSVNARARTNLDTLANQHTQQLWLLHDSPIDDGKPEPVCSDPNPTVEYTVRAHPTVLNRRVWSQHGLCAYVHARSDNTPRLQSAAWTDVCTRTNDGPWCEARAGVHVSARMDHRTLHDASQPRANPHCEVFRKVSRSARISARSRKTPTYAISAYPSTYASADISASNGRPQ